MKMKPVFSYNPGDATFEKKLIQSAAARRIEHGGRRGLQLSGIRDRFIIPRHTVNETRGALSMWVLPMQDIAPAAQYPAHAASNPHFANFTFISDRENLGDVDAAEFAMFYNTYWHPVFITKFHRGSFGEMAWRPRQSAFASSNYFEMRSLNWYHMCVTWDRPRGAVSVYANGVLVGAQDTTAGQPHMTHPCAPMLYAGNPAMAYSEINFYNEIPDAGEIRDMFRAGAGIINQDLQDGLEKTYEGKGLKPFAWEPDPAWRETLSLPMTRDEDMLAFYHQGGVTGTTVTPEGTRIVTPTLDEYYNDGHHLAKPDPTRMYLWSRQTFEGDIHASFEFKPLSHGGLCLFMAQAAGMQGEDFMKDYFLRSDGSMSMVCWEDVRNYHWEFFREMLDTRNDLVSHAMLKNPWFKPLAFQLENRRWELNRWYKLEFLQEGSRIRGAIDGVTVIDFVDTGFDNNGPVMRHGHIAIRCMMRTDIVIRNLRVRNRPLVKVLE
ncbi:MAG: DUF1961 family protein [Opitutaceae bacterium]|jgi:hypothetical protein|nr:DUF1961 family protein [Opitutaceae bacterium]